MAATTNYRWVGTTSDVWTVVTNWIDIDTGAAPATTPGDTGSRYDNVYFDTELAVGKTGPAGITIATEELQSIFVGPEYNSYVGSTAAHVICGIRTGGSVIIEGTAAGNICLSGRLDANDLKDVVILNGDVYLGGFINDLTILRGTVDITGNEVDGDVIVGYTTVPATDVTLNISAGTAMNTNSLSVFGGITTCAAGLAEIVMTAGTWRQSSTVLTLRQLGGTFTWISGTITYCNVYGGTFDCRASTTARTLTYSLCGPAATMYLNPSSRNITYTNPLVYLGGTIIPAKGDTIAP